MMMKQLFCKTITLWMLVAYLAYCLYLDGTRVHETFLLEKKVPASSPTQSPLEDIIPQNYSVPQHCTIPVNRTEILHFLNDEQTPWSDIHWRRDHRVACGRRKGFLHSHSDPTKGYILAPPEDFPTMTRAAQMQDTMRTRSVLAIPGERPQLMNFTTTHATCFLLDYLCGKNRTKLGKLRGDIWQMQQVVVQRVARAPEPHIILGVASNLQISPEAWKAFVGEAPNATAVYQQVANEFAKMNGVLEEYSELACDWQVLIDSQGGLLPHGFGSHDRIQV